LGVQADELREEQVQQHAGIGQPVRRDAHIDRHALTAHVGHRKSSALVAASTTASLKIVSGALKVATTLDSVLS
jgi:hypothetical protein